MDRGGDISQRLISDNDILKYLVTIFPDCVILRDNVRIIAIAENVAGEFQYKVSELLGKSIQQLSSDTTIVKQLESELAKGFFDNLTVPFRDKNGATAPCRISGFYLGLISDINGIAILKIKLLDEVLIPSKQLEASRNELDEFVYRTTHDLRGPLATMRGLINLLKLENEGYTFETRHLIGLLDSHAKILDDRLFNLNYLSEASHAKAVDSNLDCDDLETTLRSTLEQSLRVDGIDFQFGSVKKCFHGVDPQLTISMLNHLLMYLINLPKNSVARLSYAVDAQDSGMRIVISSEGFLTNYQIRQAIGQSRPIYTNIIMYSDLINFFAAMKIAQRLSATITMDFVEEMSQQITVIVPAG